MSDGTLDYATITHSIQLAIAPVFLLTAVSGMIAAVAGRLARIVDRARTLEEMLRASPDADVLARFYDELTTLRTRGHLTNISIGLLTLCAFMIGLTIILLFVGEILGFQAVRLAVAGFLAGVVSFLLALLCFLCETILATRMMEFRALQQHITLITPEQTRAR